MSLQFTDLVKALCTNTNPRREKHGTENVRAMDLSFCVSGENTLLDLVQPGLREHHFFNKALVAGQETLPDVVIPLPNLRFPSLPTKYVYTLPHKKVRGYRLIRDYGLQDEALDFSDAALGGIHYEIHEGGTTDLYFTVSYNGSELEDNDLYGMLSGLSSEGDVHIKLIAPGELLPAKDGKYRAGKPDTPAPATTPDGQQELGDGDGDDQDHDSLDPSSPEGALAATQH